MRAKWRLTCILYFFNMKTLLKLLLAQNLIPGMCVLFKNNLLQSDTVPLTLTQRKTSGKSTKKVSKLSHQMASHSGRAHAPSNGMLPTKKPCKLKPPCGVAITVKEMPLAKIYKNPYYRWRN